MQWTKIATDLIERRFSDYEIASIVKFQLLWAVNEEQPDKKTALRYMTAKQYDTAMTYIDSIAARVCDDVSSVIKKRNAEKIRYSKNKGSTKILQADCEQTVSSLSEQIRLDKIREDNINMQFDLFYSAYPIHKGKQKALIAYKNALKKTSHELIMQGLEAYLADIKKKNTEDKYIKHPSTWLNQGCWMDEYEHTEERNPIEENASKKSPMTEEEIAKYWESNDDWRK